MTEEQTLVDGMKKTAERQVGFHTLRYVVPDSGELGDWIAHTPMMRLTKCQSDKNANQ
jgi:hypothetical protein